MFQEMKLFGSNIKKIHILSQNKAFLIFPKTKKLLKFPEMELFSSNIKKILIFSQKKAFLIFLELEACTFQSKP